jgi:hypothetical protein
VEQIGRALVDILMVAGERVIEIAPRGIVVIRKARGQIIVIAATNEHPECDRSCAAPPATVRSHH